MNPKMDNPCQDGSRINAMLRDVVGRNFLLTLCSRMHSHCVTGDHASGAVRVHGALNLSHESIRINKNVECLIIATRNIFTQMPRVFCLEPWMRDNPDWHAFKQGLLCFENELRWVDRLSKLKQEIGPAGTAIMAADWLVNSVASLVSRHYFADQLGITNWSEKWEAWDHGDSGISEYLKELKQRKAS